MKKMLLVLAILAIATPAWAAVTITAVDSGGGVATISYSVSGGGSLVRAFALDITVSGNATITAVNELDPNYWVHPGSMTFWAGDVNSEGTVVCDANVYAGTLPGLDTNGVTIEMASLYVEGNAPSTGRTLCTVQCAGNGDPNTVLSVKVNEIRGGVVLEDITTASPTASCVVAFDCFPGTHPDWAAWNTRSKPSSWCNPRQCHGDADGVTQQRGKYTYWVSYPDLDLFLAGFPVRTTAYIDEAHHPWIAADFDHAAQVRGKYSYYVSYPDLDIFLANFPVRSTLGPAPDCLDVP